MINRDKLPKIDEMVGDRRSGQALVEFALALPFLVLLLFGVLEFGRAFQIKIVMENAAREGVHYLIYDPDDPADGFDDTILAVQAETQNSGVTIQAENITVQCLTAGVVNSPPTSCPTGSTAEVIVTYDYNIAIISFFMDPIPMQSNARMYMP